MYERCAVEHLNFTR